MRSFARVLHIAIAEDASVAASNAGSISMGTKGRRCRVGASHHIAFVRCAHTSITHLFCIVLFEILCSNPTSFPRRHMHVCCGAATSPPVHTLVVLCCSAPVLMGLLQIVCEHVRPLENENLAGYGADEVCLGLFNVATALSFLHNKVSVGASLLSGTLINTPSSFGTQ